MNFEKLDRKWKFRHQSEVFEAVLRDLKRMRGFEAHWRLARAYHFAAMQQLQNGDLEGAKRTFLRGYESAKWANALDPKRVEGHFWMAVCGIERARLIGKFSAFMAIDSAKRRLQTALELDEAFHFAGSHRVLGRIYHLTPRAVGGNHRKAEAHFRRALEICDNSTTRLYFGEFLAARGDVVGATEQFEAILAAPVDENWKWEQARDRVSAAQYLQD